MKKLVTTMVALFATAAAFAQCSPSFTATPSPTSEALLNVDFYNSTMYGATGIPSCTIDFGDGSTASYFFGSMDHNYSTPGTYTATLYEAMVDSLTMDTLCTGSTTQTFTVAYTPCGTTLANTVDSVGAAGEVVTFAATTPAGTSDITYNWSFGDGTPGVTGSPVTHTYASSGYFTVQLIASSASEGCSDTLTTYMFTSGVPSCDGKVADFTSTTYASTATFYNLSYPGGFTSSWSFGDGGTDASWYPEHTYSAAGTYTVTLVNTWTDTLTGAVTCVETTSHSVTVDAPALPSTISGSISFEGPVPTDSLVFKIWLISYDSTTHLISAVDSTSAYYDYASGSAYYIFDAVSTGSYRTKASLFYATPGATEYIPTYDSLSVYWSGAWVINHTAGISDSNVNIYMQPGTVPSGPGFIAGDVTTGAGKGTSGDVPVTGLMIYLRDVATGKVVAYTYTDATGAYSFSSIGVGSYNIYPESLNYGTIPSANFSITADAATISGVNFTQNDASLTITPATEAVANVNANTAALSTYPNPVSSTLNITWSDPVTEKVHFAVTDVTGRVVMTADKNFAAGSGKTQLNLAELKDGIYILSAKSDNINYTQKLTVQH